MEGRVREREGGGARTGGETRREKGGRVWTGGERERVEGRGLAVRERGGRWVAKGQGLVARLGEREGGCRRARTGGKRERGWKGEDWR